jgi:hypothetical protein
LNARPIKLVRKFETLLDDTYHQEELIEPKLRKDSIINEVNTNVGSSEKFDSMQFEGEIGEGSI